MSPFIKNHVRRGAKRNHTVTGKGIHSRAEKKPQYTLEQKIGFSKSQSASLGTPTFFPQVFGFNTARNQVLVGIWLDIKDVLLSHRNFIYDGGTVRRPYDFHNLTEAKKYEKAKVDKVLFSADKMDEFKKAIAHPKNKSTYNEVMPRQRWNLDGTSQIFIANDTLESRLQAQEYVRLIKKHLLEEKLVSENYSIRIFYYLPHEPELNFKEYTLVEQIMDRLEANFIYENFKMRNEKYRELSFQFLLALPKEKIKPALQGKSYKNEQILWGILRRGYIHILESLADNLGEPIQNILALIEPYEPRDISLVCYHLMRKGYFNDAYYLIEKHKESIDFNQCIHGNPLLFLAVDNINAKLVSALLKYGANPNYESDGAQHEITPAMYAAKHGDLEIFKLLVESSPQTVLHQKDSEGNKIIYYTVVSGKVELLQYLIEEHKSLPEERNEKITLLLDAAQIEHIEAVKYLLKKIVVLDKEEKHRFLEVSEKNGDFYLKCLQANIIAVNEKNQYGLTPMLVAAQHGYLNIVIHLAKFKDLLDDCHEKSGATLLHFAAQGGNIEMVKFLIEECRVPFDQLSKNNTTPLDLAMRHYEDKKRFAIVRSLLIYGARLRKIDDSIGNCPERWMLAEFINMPFSSNRYEEKSIRENYLRDFRQRKIAILDQKESMYQQLRYIFNEMPEEKMLREELDEFAQVDEWVKRLQQVIAKKQRLKNSSLEQCLENDIQIIDTIIDTTYSIFSEKKNAKDALNYLRKNCFEVLNSSIAFSSEIYSSFPFFKKPTFKEDFEIIFRDMEKYYPQEKRDFKNTK